MQRFRCVVIVVGVLALITVEPCNAQADQASAEILAVEKGRTLALEHADVNALQKLLADDLTYVHASGKIDTKASFLDAIRSGTLHYISWNLKESHARRLGETAVLNGRYSVHVRDRRVQPDPFEVNVIFLTVYAKRNGQWQQVAWQTTRDVQAKPAQ